MRISELSEATGVSIPTIKFYLRERLLPAGTPRTTNQADYDERHVRRLRLIRALVEVGDLPLGTVRRVLAAVDDEALPMHEALATAHRWLGPDVEASPEDPLVADARRDVDQLLRDLGWQVSPDSPGRAELAVALATLRRLGWPNAGPELFVPYAEVADRVAEREVSRATPPGLSRAESVELVVIGTVVFDAVFSALRRLAQERHSAVLLGSRTRP